MVWADPFSLAATGGIAFALFSSGYLDGSVHLVIHITLFYSGNAITVQPVMGFPIRRSSDHSL